MNETKNDFCQCLFYSANALSRTMTRLADEAFSKTGLAPSYAFLLMAVNRKPGIQPGELAETMLLSPSTVTRLIEKMESKGFLERKSEGKNVFVRPTEKSIQINDQLKSAWFDLYHQYVGILGEEAAKKLTSDIYSGMEKLEGNG